MKKISEIRINRNLMLKIGVHPAISYSILKERYGKDLIVDPIPLLVDTLGITSPTARKFIRVLESEKLIEKDVYKDRSGYTYRFIR